MRHCCWNTYDIFSLSFRKLVRFILHSSFSQPLNFSKYLSYAIHYDYFEANLRRPLLLTIKVTFGISRAFILSCPLEFQFKGATILLHQVFHDSEGKFQKGKGLISYVSFQQIFILTLMGVIAPFFTMTWYYKKTWVRVVRLEVV